MKPKIGDRIKVINEVVHRGDKDRFAKLGAVGTVMGVYSDHVSAEFDSKDVLRTTTHLILTEDRYVVLPPPPMNNKD